MSPPRLTSIIFLKMGKNWMCWTEVQGQLTIKLEAYFQTNATDPLVRNILYPDFPDHYTWVSGRKKWKRRQRGKMTWRIPIINFNPHQAELLYLRMLIYNKAGATSFGDLRSVNDIVTPIFQEACVRLGLFQSDDSLDRVEGGCFYQIWRPA